jgi:hypothetical protein
VFPVDCIAIRQHYSSIMPLLLNVLRNANRAVYRKLRVKATACTVLIGSFLLCSYDDLCTYFYV